MNTTELAWFKSSYSSGGDGDCVEVATCTGTIHVRDSKVRQGAQLALSPTAWTRFLNTCVHEMADQPQALTTS
ncbi:DUF397 domain-containing protein [Streptomyces rubrogriseus]|uniref:DUF397 domain-containing protein n=1 Tax=Streptomyces rubrogriseus TaxID=194673 RepID=A0A6G3TMX2_9ACTN|nr:DUF397 domain-containing protein [Streptomyces rubrogriseus]NEC37351.1 DUF397 domain-containing protein [Streptomyces rubrogriseus]